VYSRGAERTSDGVCRTIGDAAGIQKKKQTKIYIVITMTHQIESNQTNVDPSRNGNQNQNENENENENLKQLRIKSEKCVEWVETLR